MYPLETARGTDAGADGSIYVAETSADRVLKVDKDGKVEILLDDDHLTAPRDVAVPADDSSCYVADTGNARILKRDPLGNVSTFAGGGDPDTLGDGGAATHAGLKQPRGLALAADGTLYITETAIRASSSCSFPGAFIVFRLRFRELFAGVVYFLDEKFVPLSRFL